MDIIKSNGFGPDTEWVMEGTPIDGDFKKVGTEVAHEMEVKRARRLAKSTGLRMIANDRKHEKVRAARDNGEYR